MKHNYLYENCSCFVQKGNSMCAHIRSIKANKRYLNMNLIFTKSFFINLPHLNIIFYNFIVFGLSTLGLESKNYTVKASTLIIKPLIRFRFKYGGLQM